MQCKRVRPTCLLRVKQIVSLTLSSSPPLCGELLSVLVLEYPDSGCSVSSSSSSSSDPPLPLCKGAHAGRVCCVGPGEDQDQEGEDRLCAPSTTSPGLTCDSSSPPDTLLASSLVLERLLLLGLLLCSRPLISSRARCSSSHRDSSWLVVKLSLREEVIKQT